MSSSDDTDVEIPRERSKRKIEETLLRNETKLAKLDSNIRGESLSLPTLLANEIPSVKTFKKFAETSKHCASNMINGFDASSDSDDSSSDDEMEFLKMNKPPPYPISLPSTTPQGTTTTSSSTATDLNNVKFRWTTDMDDNLREGHKSFGNDWVQIANYVNSTSENIRVDRHQCFKRFALMQGSKHGPFTPEEDEVIVRVLADWKAGTGTGMWTHIASLLDRNQNSCRHRWSYLQGSKSGMFSAEEDAKLVEVVGSWPTDKPGLWIYAASVLDRNQNSCRQRWNRFLTKRKKESQQQQQLSEQNHLQANLQQQQQQQQQQQHLQMQQHLN